jgi:hypothetical protein
MGVYSGGIVAAGTVAITVLVAPSSTAIVAFSLVT